jgi:hypothetical protein
MRTSAHIYTDTDRHTRLPSQAHLLTHIQTQKKKGGVKESKEARKDIADVHWDVRASPASWLVAISIGDQLARVAVCKRVSRLISCQRFCAPRAQIEVDHLLTLIAFFLLYLSTLAIERSLVKGR